MTPAGFPHSDTPGSTLGCQLPRAYRRLLRPSSALDAKASTMCPSQLVTHTTNPTHPPDTRTTATHKDPTTHTHTAQQDSHEDQADATITTGMHNKRSDPTRQCTRHTTKMLASTIQISNNNPTPHHPPPHGSTGTARTIARQPSTRSTATDSPRAGLLGPDSSEPQQCAPTPDPPARRTSPHSGRPRDTPHDATGWGDVDDSTSEHHQLPPHDPAGTVPNGDDDRGVCSLERR